MDGVASLQDDPVDSCPLVVTEDITQYQIKYVTKWSTYTENVNTSRCINGRCSNIFVPPSSLTAYYYYYFVRVTAAAENVVGRGAERTCTTQYICKCPVKYFRVNLLSKINTQDKS